ncbi:MAG TPA: ABC transporter substrate-binding protein [Candidatus Acidoferrum sp.]
MLAFVKIVWRISLTMILAGIFPLMVLAQIEPSIQPYAAMDREKVSFQGPGRDTGSDIHNSPVGIGLVLPLQGARAIHGKLLLQAAQMAVDEENANAASAGSPRFALAVRNESEQWGQASNAMVQLITQDQVVAIITSSDGRIAHQAEQIVNKLGAPVLTLSSDPTTTQINIPWIFRVGLSDSDQARAIVNDILRTGKSRKILLIAEADYDGRIGGDEFAKTSSQAREPLPDRIDVDTEKLSLADLLQQIDSRRPHVIVLWSGSELAERLASALSQRDSSIELYLSQKSAAFFSLIAERQSGVQISVASSGMKNEGFANLYAARTGLEPSMAAQQIYIAIRTAIRAIQAVGANRARVRDYLASGRKIGSEWSVICFDPAGNSLGEVSLKSLNMTPNREMQIGAK